MDTAALIERLAAEGELLQKATRRADLAAPVPGLEWNVRDVVTHTGAVHRWAADIVRRGLSSNETGGSRAFHEDISDDDLADWYGAALGELVQTLRDAPDDLEAWTFTRGAAAKWFWTRRQAHETAIHRADVEVALGEVQDVPADFAQDGIEELAAGFARNRAFAVAEEGALALAASDGPSWLITFGGERIEASRSDEPGDATVSGSSSDLYRWLWNRPSPAIVSGSETVVAHGVPVRI